VKKRLITCTVLVLCLLVVVASPVLAGGLTVIGGKVEASVTPGNDYSYAMRVMNTSDAAMDIGVEVKGYGTSPGHDFVVVEPGADTTPQTAKDLLSVSPSSFHLELGASQVITVTAKIGPGIGDGGRYGAVFIHTAPKGDAVATVAAVAAGVLLTIHGSALIHTSEITTLVLPDGGGALDTLVTIGNTGNHHYKPTVRGEIVTEDRVVATAVLKSDWPMIPGYDRQFKLKFEPTETMQPGRYEVRVKVADDSGSVVASRSAGLELGTPVAAVAPAPAPLVAPSTTLPVPSDTLLVSAVTPAFRGDPNWAAIAGGAAGAVVLGFGMYLFGVRRGRGR
jgi:hypothetical protein